MSSQINIKELLSNNLRKAIESCPPEMGLNSLPELPPVFVEVPRDRGHGDYVTSIAMSLASQAGKRSREVADKIVECMDDSTHYLERIEVAGPGFINFYFGKEYWYKCLGEVHRLGSSFGRNELGKGSRVLIEFVSANPTGPLHIGHGRGAAVGDSLANVLSASGYEVFREYYINDTGSQMNKLGRSVYFRYQELLGKNVEFPEDGYPGEYIKDIAGEIKSREG
ncbi:MAG: arginine--tRNA ligase, partial [Deltaproteobacteria bacterium]